LPPDMPPDETRTVLAGHRRRVVFVTRFDLDASNQCVHRSSLAVWQILRQAEVCEPPMKRRKSRTLTAL